MAVRFSPQIYKLRPTETTPTFKLDYRMYTSFLFPCSLGQACRPYRVLTFGPLRRVFAVATFDSVFVYDTQHGYPLCHITGLHYASQTDLSWFVPRLMHAQ